MHDIPFWSQTYCFAFITAICFHFIPVTGVKQKLEEGKLLEIGHSCHYLQNLNAIKPLFCVHIFIKFTQTFKVLCKVNSDNYEQLVLFLFCA